MLKPSRKALCKVWIPSRKIRPFYPSHFRASERDPPVCRAQWEYVLFELSSAERRTSRTGKIPFCTSFGGKRSAKRTDVADAPAHAAYQGCPRLPLPSVALLCVVALTSARMVRRRRDSILGSSVFLVLRARRAIHWATCASLAAGPRATPKSSERSAARAARPASRRRCRVARQTVPSQHLCRPILKLEPTQTYF